MRDPLSELRAAGFPVDQLSTSQREVLAALSEPEITVLVSVQSRLQEAAGEVVAHDVKML